MCSEKELSSNFFIFSNADHFLTFFQRGITNRQVVTTISINHFGIYSDLYLEYASSFLRVILCFLSTFVHIISFYSTSYILTLSRFHIYIAIYFHSKFLPRSLRLNIRFYFMLRFGSVWNLCLLTSSRICGTFVYFHRGFRVYFCIYSSWHYFINGIVQYLERFLYTSRKLNQQACASRLLWRRTKVLITQPGE